ncbi:9104_t:CDS:2, partial [Dentiscutata heterogama]
MIDPSLERTMTTSNLLKRQQLYNNFLKSHCQVQTNIFQIKKCTNIKYGICQPIRMPLDEFENLCFLSNPKLFADKEHYKDFNSVYGHLTNERYQLSQQEVTNKEFQTGIFVNNKIQLLVCCDFCGKYRYIYCNTCLNEDDSTMIIQYLENISYSCGSPILPDKYPLFDQLYIHQNLTCNLPIEQNYYSCHIKDVDLCYWCEAEDNIIDPSEELKSQFKTIYPLCISCEANGCEWSTRAPIVFQSKTKKVHTIVVKLYIK